MTSTAPITGAFTRGPEVVVVLDGTCPNPASTTRAKVTGEVAILFQGHAQAMIGTSGRAHVNDNNRGIEYKGERFLASNHYQRQADGSWTVGWTSVSDRDNWKPGGANKTNTAAITEALAHELEKAWTPELEREATRAALMTALYHADREEAEARAEHDRAAAVQAELREKLAAL